MEHREVRVAFVILDQALRRRIYEHIQAHPGETYTDIKQSLSLSKGGLTHHLEVLRREGFVRVRSEGGRKTFYSADACPAGGDYRPRTQTRMLGIFAREPGAAISEVAGVLGISRQLATHHARLLAQERLVRLERRKNRLCAVPVRSPELPS